MILANKDRLRQSFPTEAELCRTYDVSRFTVREALRRLQQEGLIARRRGSGTVVQPAAARGGALHQPLSNVGEILQYARGTQIRWERLPPGRIPRSYAEQLEPDVSGEWLRLQGVRQDGGGNAIAVTEAFVHQRLAGAIEDLDPNRHTLFRQLSERAGLEVARVTQDIQAVSAPAAVARALGMAPRAASLRVLRCYYDQADFLFEISASHHPGDRFAYSMHIDIDR